jgi:hypothetical protein
MRGLFNDAASNFDFIASIGWEWIMDGKEAKKIVFFESKCVQSLAFRFKTE